ncbi:hypothetical protein PF005_g4840 [Phytophthora fragariae]|uniref:Uncharacterized protein n=1 Tax=Phytophthora fragariae TaxID=53985 RepID=A0A6A3JFP8_9STRA|nr:hypothetical protein PF011_g17178 [Phytophthora fragariae]KAE9147257.1 hypothetical protein PF006_g8050 [Phytophthora fragariae]KAE9206015.1 hypothetical protein PF004_g17419 [Phytophthora fragariae]KAE9227162.1 hypothetical protein PF005_g4840 [Phytophthora fragariae]KAE9241039.1 hypothetical protein PF002_g9464 [Phytophthora fragariae]
MQAQGRMFAWTARILTFTLEHSRSDFNFQFEWCGTNIRSYCNARLTIRHGLDLAVPDVVRLLLELRRAGRGRSVVVVRTG